MRKIIRFGKMTLAAAVAVGTIGSTPLRAEVAVKDGQKIAFMGDSITQAGAGPDGYVTLVIRGLEANGIKATPVPAGISGHKSNNMLERLERDVLSKKPDWMTLSCGVNDVWHGANGVPLDQYRVNITRIVDQCQAAGVKVMILTSTMIGEDQPNPNNQKLVAYNDFLRTLAAEKNCLLADLNADMQAIITNAGPEKKGNLLTGDGVHMNPAGNVMMATGVLRAFGLSEEQIAKAQLGPLPSAGAPKPDARMQAEAERIVSQYKTSMDAPPKRVPSRDIVDGPLLGNGDLGAVISGAPEAQRFWISKNNFWRLKEGHRQGGPRLFGGLEINTPALAGATYLLEQQIFPALTTARFTKGESTVTMRSWVAATDDVLLVELAVEGTPVEVATRLWAAPGRGSKEQLGRKDAVLWATKAFADDVNIPTLAACGLTVLGGKPTVPELEPVVVEPVPEPPPRRAPPRKAQSQPGPMFTLEPGQNVTLAVALQSSFDSKDPLATVLQKAAAMNADAVARLLAQHTRWWREFWAQSLVEINDPFLEKQYYLANYELGSALRDPEFPTGLFGLWVTDDDPRWSGDYHLNFDYQSQFYGLYKSNHLEQANTYHAPILAFMERGKFYAKKLCNTRGVLYSVGIGAKGIETCLMGNRTNGPYQEGGCFMGQKCNAAYSVVPMSMHWYHTYDKEYAKKVYPFVLEVANFWEDYLKFEDGRYVIHNDSIQENSGEDMNSIMSLGLVRNAFETAVDMSRELGVDADRHAKWQDILQKLSKFPTFEKDGVTVFRYTEKGTEWIDGNSCVLQHIYPSGALGLDDDPKLLEIARNTINAKGRKWAGDNGENSHYPAAVRVGYDPKVILQNLTTLWSTSRKIASGLPEDPEQSSTVPNTINEMLCMSHRQVLRVFPVWPKDKDARFRNLRAEGAFLVSSALKGGAVQHVKIASERGRDCTLVNPWPGKAVDVYQNGRKVQTLTGDRMVLKTEVGATYGLRPEGAAAPVAE